MIFAKIDYLNLLPFYLFLKRHLRSSQLKASIAYKKDVPANINRAFHSRRIDAAFISSVTSQKSKCTDIGIIANKKVKSVLVLKGDLVQDDESSTSNILTEVLGIKGKVLIGDKALKYYHDDNDREYIDLATEWYKRYKEPFVFARLCYNKNGCQIKKAANKFIQEKSHPIPQYMLKKYANKIGITTSQAREYLKLINYKIDSKEKRSLKRFLRLANNIR